MRGLTGFGGGGGVFGIVGAVFTVDLVGRIGLLDLVGLWLGSDVPADFLLLNGLRDRGLRFASVVTASVNLLRACRISWLPLEVSSAGISGSSTSTSSISSPTSCSSNLMSSSWLSSSSKSGTGLTGEVTAALGIGLLFRDATASLAFGGREDEDGLESTEGQAFGGSERAFALVLRIASSRVGGGAVERSPDRHGTWSSASPRTALGV